MQIDVVDARLSFDGRLIFDSFTARFPSDRVTALVGPSGSGKSSLLSAMAGFQKLDSGAICWSTGDESRTPPIPTSVSWIPQGSNAIGIRTALDNVMIGPLAEGKSLEQANELSASALADVGLEHATYRRARTLSGGELQRMCFARALASDKPFIFADEPSSSLDAENTERLAELIHALRARATIVVATHDPLLISAAECQVHLRSGRPLAA